MAKPPTPTPKTMWEYLYHVPSGILLLLIVCVFSFLFYVYRTGEEFKGEWKGIKISVAKNKMAQTSEGHIYHGFFPDFQKSEEPLKIGEEKIEFNFDISDKGELSGKSVAELYLTLS